MEWAHLSEFQGDGWYGGCVECMCGMCGMAGRDGVCVQSLKALALLAV